MNRIKHTRPSPALILSVLALFVALGGTAIAVTKAPKNTVASKSIKKGAVKSADISDKKGVKSKDIVDGEVKGTDVDESSLGQVPSAASATNATDADKLDGKDASQLQTASAYAEEEPNLALTGVPQDVVTTSVTTTGTRIVATASLTVDGNGNDDDTAACRLQIAGTAGFTYVHDIPDHVAQEGSNMALTFARTVSPGTHSVELTCDESGDVTVKRAALSVVAVGE